MRKVTFRSIQRATKANEGIYGIGLDYMDENGKVTSTVDLGKVLLSKKDNKYYAYRGEIEGKADVVGETLSKAGEGLRKLYDAENKGETPSASTRGRGRGRPRKSTNKSTSSKSNSVPMDVAAKKLCGTLANPMAGLKRRISTGKVQTVTVDGETRVVM